MDFIPRALGSHRRVLNRAVTGSDFALERSLRPQCRRGTGGDKRDGGQTKQGQLWTRLWWCELGRMRGMGKKWVEVEIIRR